MGLDQYISKKKTIMTEKSRRLVEEDEVAYFRKHNALHGWMLENLCLEPDFNCQDALLSLENVEKCLADIDKVLSAPENLRVEMAKEVFPACEGFFFGCYDYDEYYFDQLRYEYDTLMRILEDWDEEADYYYHCWW